MGAKVSYSNSPIIGTFAHSERKTIAERVLIGAMLREPHNLIQTIDQLNEVALSTATEGRAAIFAEIVKQAKQRGTFSISSVEIATGDNSLPYLAAENTDVDLQFAIDNYTFEFETWAEIHAIQVACNPEHVEAGAAAIRAAAETARIQVGASEAKENTDGRVEFENWMEDRVSGKVEAFKCAPPVAAIRSIVNGWRPGEMIVIAARPGMGKTQFALNCLAHMEQAGAKGLFFTLEMQTNMILQRMLGIKHGINPRADLRGIDSLKDAGADVLRMNLNIIDNLFSIDAIERRAIAQSYKGGLDYIVVDYLGLITHNAGKGVNREQVIAHISGTLTRLAKRLKIPVIVLSQLSRAVEQRGGSKRPMLSDLRESGSIEQDASVVCFLFRPEYYGILQDENGQSLEGVAEVIIAKQRNGATDTALCGYDPIRGYRDKEHEPSKLFPHTTTTPPPFPITRPSITEDIPF